MIPAKRCFGATSENWYCLIMFPCMISDIEFSKASISGGAHEKDTRTEFENMMLSWGHGCEVRLYTKSKR